MIIKRFFNHGFIYLQFKRVDDTQSGAYFNGDYTLSMPK